MHVSISDQPRGARPWRALFAYLSAILAAVLFMIIYLLIAAAWNGRLGDVIASGLPIAVSLIAALWFLAALAALPGYLLILALNWRWNKHSHTAYILGGSIVMIPCVLILSLLTVLCFDLVGRPTNQAIQLIKPLGKLFYGGFFGGLLYWQVMK